MKSFALLTALLASGCAGVGPFPNRVADCPGAIPEPASLQAGDFILRERVRVEAPGVELALLLVAERRGDRLVLVGMDAFGARALSVVQEGPDLEADARYGRTLAITPENLLRDLHAAGRFGPGTAAGGSVQRTGCEHTSSFIREERRALP